MESEISRDSSRTFFATLNRKYQVAMQKDLKCTRFCHQGTLAEFVNHSFCRTGQFLLKDKALIQVIYVLMTKAPAFQVLKAKKATETQRQKSYSKPNVRLSVVRIAERVSVFYFAQFTRTESLLCLLQSEIGKLEMEGGSNLDPEINYVLVKMF